MNCGNSCPSIPRKREITGSTNRPPLLSDHLYEIYDIPSMGGTGVGTASKKLLSQYNAEFDSEEDSNEGERPLMPIALSSISPQAAIIPVSVPVVPASPVSVPVVATTVPVSIISASPVSVPVVPTTVPVPVVPAVLTPIVPTDISMKHVMNEVLESQPSSIESEPLSSLKSEPLSTTESQPLTSIESQPSATAETLVVSRSLSVHQALTLSVYSSMAVL
jgi:hypothetical protein